MLVTSINETTGKRFHKVRVACNIKASERGFHKVQVTCHVKKLRAGNRKIKATCIVKKSNGRILQGPEDFGSVKRF